MDGEWYCENHPESLMGHDGCEGAGVPEQARNEMLVIQRRNALQKYREMKFLYEDMILGLLKRNSELENREAEN